MEKQGEFEQMTTQPSAEVRKESELQAIVEHQLNMESLWLMKPTISEAILIAALRHLHAVIEGDEVMAALSKRAYWNLESEL